MAFVFSLDVGLHRITTNIYNETTMKQRASGNAQTQHTTGQQDTVVRPKERRQTQAKDHNNGLKNHDRV